MDKCAEHTQPTGFGQALGLASVCTRGPATAVPASPREDSDETGRPQGRTMKARCRPTEATARRPAGFHGQALRSAMRQVHTFDGINRCARMLDAQFKVHGHRAVALTQQTIGHAGGGILRITGRRQHRDIGRGLGDGMGGAWQPGGAVSAHHGETSRPQSHYNGKHPRAARQPLRMGTARVCARQPGAVDAKK